MLNFSSTYLRYMLIILLFSIGGIPNAIGQQFNGISSSTIENSFLTDRNNNGLIDIVAFGDSLTRGTGDFTGSNETIFSAHQPSTEEAGYPLRLELLLEMSVENRGVPGEVLVDEGIFRFARLIPQINPDIVVIGGGANDSIFLVTGFEYFRSVQAMINIAQAGGTLPVLITISPVCCNFITKQPFIDVFNEQLIKLHVSNEVPLAPITRAFDSVCPMRSNCPLLNLPEGLHPNSRGYDLMGEIVASTLLDINLLTEDGQREYQDALNLTEGSIITVPDETL